jgi:hypothetical protein
MKKFGILMFSALMLFGMMACEKSATAEGGNADSTGTALGTTAPNPDGTTAEPVSNLPLTTAEFMEESFNFGEVAEGDKVVHTFKFKNTGSNPLHVDNVKASCGCTSPDWSKEDVAPGAEGFVTVEFDSKGKRGVQKKSVTVTFANTDPKNKILSFNCEVTGAE